MDPTNDVCGCLPFACTDFQEFGLEKMLEEVSGREQELLSQRDELLHAQVSFHTHTTQ